MRTPFSRVAKIKTNSLLCIPPPKATTLSPVKYTKAMIFGLMCIADKVFSDKFDSILSHIWQTPETAGQIQ